MAKFFGRKEDPKAADVVPPAEPTEPPVPAHRPADAGAGGGGHVGAVAGVPPDGGEAAPAAETAPPPGAAHRPGHPAAAGPNDPKATADAPPKSRKFRVTLPGWQGVEVEVPGSVAPADATAAAVAEFQRVAGLWSLPCPPSVEPVGG
jgi:hypothetical protein